MRTNRAASLFKLLLVMSLSVIIVHIALKYISVVVFDEKHGFLFELSNRFDLNDENSVPQWFSQTLFLLTGLGAFLAAYLSEKKPLRRLWTTLGVAGVLLSLDDAATLHEFILQTVHNNFFVDTAPSLLRNAWLVLAPAVLIVLLWLAVKVFQHFPRRTAFLIMTGAAIFFTGALAVDSLVNTVPERSFMGQGLLSALEGGMQLLGITILFYAVADYLERHHAAALKDALAKLRPRRT